MFDSNTSMDAGGEAQRMDAPITVFVNRAGFERGISRMLSRGTGEGVMLHLTLRSQDGHTGCVGRKLLNLAGNTLRVAMRSGAAVYLGNAEFAVFLQDAGVREAAAYARTVIQIIDRLRVTWDHEALSVQASIGGVMAGDAQDGAALLDQAVAAGEHARAKLGCKMYILYAQEPLPALRQFAPASTVAFPA
ncbi:MAG TPA: diguanylate cyclase [Gammaproteobacteria bacterium]|nr:diguanylate cyclase [Gammaproteobacteria bacterium]